MAFDPFLAYYTPEPTSPSGGPTPGAEALLDWICDESPWAADFSPLGIYNPRDICGNLWPDWSCTGSQHAAGRAGDAGCLVVRPDGLPEGWALAAWLIAHHELLGVQEVIFAGKRWDNQSQRWRIYSGRDDHFGHVHFALNTSGAALLTRARILSVAPAAPEPLPTPPTPIDLEDDMPLIIHATGRATRCWDGGAAPVIDALTLWNTAASGVKQAQWSPQAYDALLAHVDKLQGKTLVKAIEDVEAAVLALDT